MTLLSFLILLLIAGIYGAIGRAIVGFRGGILVSIAIGFIGALIGMWLSVALGLREMFAVYVGASANKISTTIYSGLEEIGHESHLSANLASLVRASSKLSSSA
jgi:uncharacterized membrane protein YeaQ/YmgE (transglycosylase-associated protein family)